MDDIIKLLKIARDETTTLVTYAEMLDGMQNGREETLEIMGDEANHTLVSLFKACQLLGITIPTDGVEEAMEKLSWRE